MLKKGLRRVWAREALGWSEPLGRARDASGQRGAGVSQGGCGEQVGAGEAPARGPDLGHLHQILATSTVTVRTGARTSPP